MQYSFALMLQAYPSENSFSALAKLQASSDIPCLSKVVVCSFSSSYVTLVPSISYEDSLQLHAEAIKAIIAIN